MCMPLKLDACEIISSVVSHRINKLKSKRKRKKTKCNKHTSQIDNFPLIKKQFNK